MSFPNNLALTKMMRGWIARHFSVRKPRSVLQKLGLAFHRTMAVSSSINSVTFSFRHKLQST